MGKVFCRFMHAVSVLIPFLYIFYLILDGIAISGDFSLISLGEALLNIGIDIQIPSLEDSSPTLFSIYYLVMSTPLFVWLMIIFVPIAIITYNKMDGY